MRELDRIASESILERYAIVGAGRLGHALAAALRDAGLEGEGPLGRGARAEAPVVLSPVPDAKLRAAAKPRPAQLTATAPAPRPSRCSAIARASASTR